MLLFEDQYRFEGLPLDRFGVFGTPDRRARRRQILDAFHPPLDLLAHELLARLNDGGDKAPLRAHLPRLDWPAGYQPFCTWLALSPEAHGYQQKAQLNLGVHPDYVALRLGWDASQTSFSRFEFRARHGGLGKRMAEIARENDLEFRVYASAKWPIGSRCVYRSAVDWQGAFEEVRRRGVWFELGRRYDLSDAGPLIGSDELAREALRVFRAVLPAARSAWR
ncbi:hypothetical protein ABI59_12440 [Acidobacteria bacterium Mor1]|nr:hypothetical protein ABI59_12440 [Acidobacteria bacterium Mor1]